MRKDRNCEIVKLLIFQINLRRKPEYDYWYVYKPFSGICPVVTTGVANTSFDIKIGREGILSVHLGGICLVVTARVANTLISTSPGSLFKELEWQQLFSCGFC